MTIFRLEPWELPPGCDEPLEAPVGVIVTIQRDKKKVEVALRVVKAAKFRYLIFARFVAQAENGSWLVVRHDSMELLLVRAVRSMNSGHWIEDDKVKLAPMIWETRPSERKMRGVAHNVALNRNFQFVRFATFDFTTPRAAVFYQNGKATWLHDDLTEAAPFVLRLSGSSVQTRDALRCEWENPESDARFAWEWANLGESERETLIYKGKKGRDELQRVMLLVMQCAPELWDEGDAWAWIIGDINEKKPDAWVIYSQQQRRIIRPPRLARWNRFLMEHFAPLLRIILHGHMCVASTYPSVSSLTVQLDAPPTAHERLEARLQLLDWLAKNVSPQRARWLKP